MARDASGNYTLPASYEVAVGDTLDIEQHNPPFEDLEAEMEDSLCRSGKGGMLANLDMGGFDIDDAGDVEADTATFTTTNADTVHVDDNLYLDLDGDADNPVIRFNDADTGFFKDGTDLKVTIDGTVRAIIEDATSPSNDETLLTKEMGDARYLLSAGGTIDPDDLPTATTSEQGAVELATDAEAKAGTADKIPDADAMMAAFDVFTGVVTKHDSTHYSFTSATGWASPAIEITPDASAAGLEVHWSGYVGAHDDHADAYAVIWPKYKDSGGSWQSVPTDQRTTICLYMDTDDGDIAYIKSTCAMPFFLDDTQVNASGNWEVRMIGDASVGDVGDVWDQIWAFRQLSYVSFEEI